MNAVSPDAAGPGDAFHDDLGDRRGLNPALIKELTRLNPLRSTFSVLRTWLEIAVLMALAVRFPEWWVVAPCMLLIATRAQSLFILAMRRSTTGSTTRAGSTTWSAGCARRRAASRCSPTG